VPGADWSQVVNVAWGVFIGLTLFVAIVGSLCAAVLFSFSIIEESLLSAVGVGLFAWVCFALPVCLVLGGVVVAVAYVVSLGVQAILPFIHI
jgi:hypothetical protein